MTKRRVTERGKYFSYLQELTATSVHLVPLSEYESHGFQLKLKFALFEGICGNLIIKKNEIKIQKHTSRTLAQMIWTGKKGREGGFSAESCTGMLRPEVQAFLSKKVPLLYS